MLPLLRKFEAYYLYLRSNRWYWYLSIICRVSLAFGFFVAGMVKIVDERFASGLSELQPMGSYLTALHHTGYYYTFIGIAQVFAAILLLIPRTVFLGALIYLPIILNICTLSFALRFDGSFVSSPLMVLANIYLLVWHYDKLRYILPLNPSSALPIQKNPPKWNNKFPWKFAMCSVAIMVLTIVHSLAYNALPKNTINACRAQFTSTDKEKLGYKFCDCVHLSTTPLDQCLEELEQAN